MIKNYDDETINNFNKKVTRLAILSDAEQLLINGTPSHVVACNEVRLAFQDFYKELLFEVCDLYSECLLSQTINFFEEVMLTDTFTNLFYSNDYVDAVIHGNKTIYDMIDDIDATLNEYILLVESGNTC